MAAYFPDSSALAKRYVSETGSNWLRTLLNPTTGCTVVIVRITAAEIIAALSRRERSQTLSPADATTARTDFRTDLANEYQIVEADEPVINQAMLLAEKYKIRGYDAVQLAAALLVNGRLVAAGQPPITLISADAELNKVGMTEGLIVEDPNAHP